MGQIDWSAVLTMQCGYDAAKGTIEGRVEIVRKDVCKYVRALLTHPVDDAAEAFYRRFGFESTPTHEPLLILLLKDARPIAGAVRLS